MDRKIGDVDSLKNVDELWVYLYREKCFRYITEANYPPKKCLICPKRWNKKNEDFQKCRFVPSGWKVFKSHLTRAEKLFGQIVAYPANSLNLNDLPDVKVYERFRDFGQLNQYLDQDTFYIYDLKLRKFIESNRNDLRRRYFNNQLCDYCNCNKQMRQVETLINHLSVFEKKYFCYLMMKDLKHNDQRNQLRLIEFANDFDSTSNHFEIEKNATSKSIEELINDLNDSSDDEVINVETDTTDSDEIEKRNQKSVVNYDDTDEELVDVPKAGNFVELNNFEDSKQEDLNSKPNLTDLISNISETITQRDIQIKEYVEQLKNASKDEVDLKNAVIKHQEEFDLKMYGINFTSLSCLKQLSVDNDDMKPLLKRYKIPDNLEIESCELVINLKLKENSLFKSSSPKITPKSQYALNESLIDKDHNASRSSSSSFMSDFEPINSSFKVKEVKTRKKRSPKLRQTTSKSITNFSNLIKITKSPSSDDFKYHEPIGGLINPQEFSDLKLPKKNELSNFKIPKRNSTSDTLPPSNGKSDSRLSLSPDYFKKRKYQ